jgi:hypothetical protein
MRYMKRYFSTLLAVILFVDCSYAQNLDIVTSPDKKISIRCRFDESGSLTYVVMNNGKVVLEPSQLGVIREDGDFSKGLKFLSISKIQEVTDKYILANAKRRNNVYKANRLEMMVKNAKGDLMNIIFQVSNDGVAFRYFFPENSSELKKINGEVTSFKFPDDTKAWLQPMSKAKSGWQKVNPCYEEFYEKEIPAGTAPTLGAGWVFPALFKTGDTWLLITEAGVDSNYCASKLDNARDDRTYKIAFPDPVEIFPGGPNTPQRQLPWFSPWRIITIGSLATIVESTLGTDLAPPAKQNLPFARPGKASWSWPILKDDSITYSVQKRFIDYAADMKWQYCLIDVNWDTKIGMDSIQLLIDYAKQKNVGVWLWYNSAGSWNTTPYHPRSKLLTHEDRVREFSMLQKMGVAGIKVDFFGGDGQSMMKYYIDMMNDAAAHNLMVNFHGATLPRGWQRTYPNLMTAEAIKGFEYVTFEQKNADEEPAHCTLLPFTRNAFDPMDFTPMSLDRIPRIKRKTTAAFELALSVLFLSGVQHFAETPQGMSKVPVFAKEFLKALPVSWEDVKFIDGYPGKAVVLARKSEKNWYVAGINGENTDRELVIDLSFAKKQSYALITEGSGQELLTTKAFPLPANGQVSVKIKAGGGFIIFL